MAMDETRLERLAKTIGEAAFQKFIAATIADIQVVRDRLASTADPSLDVLHAAAHKLVGLLSQGGLVNEAADLRMAMAHLGSSEEEGPRLVRLCDAAVSRLGAFLETRSRGT